MIVKEWKKKERKIMENDTNYSSVYQNSEMIRNIERLGGKYDPTSIFSLYDQLLICESLEGYNEINSLSEKYNNDANESVNVKWNDNGTYKRDAISKQTNAKLNAIDVLKTFNYKTPPIEIAKTLEILFIDCASQEGHWLYIAQNWTPRAINGVIKNMIKIHTTGRASIKKPAAYFTYLMKLRKKRKGVRVSHENHKHSQSTA